MQIRVIFFAVLALFLAGCGSGISVTLKGEPGKPLPPNCDFVFLEVDPDKASLEFQQLGIVTVEDGKPGDVSADLKEKIRPHVCRMGGERVVPMTDVHSWQSDTASYLVLKSKS